MTGSGARWPGCSRRRGARMVEYWHWHTLPFGAEAHRAGCCRTAAFPRAREIARMGADLRQVGDAFADATPDADVVVPTTRTEFARRPRGPCGGDGPMMVDPTRTGTS